MELFWPGLLLILMLAAIYVGERIKPEFVNALEENFIALLLAIITIVSFTQVIARYGFNSGWSGALELTRILFAWIILFGASWGVKHGMHLGVDAVIRLFPKPIFRIAAVFGALCVFLYAAMLLHAGWLGVFGANPVERWQNSGALGYWTFMYDRGTGLDDLRYPVWMQETFGLQERAQRWIAYLALPMGLSLIGYRAVQAMIQIVRGDRELIIAGHEAEELVAANKDALKD